MKIFEVGLGSEKILVCQYAPSIQIQSALDPISKEYFLKIFKSKKPNIDEFAHSYVPADTSGQSMGARMVVYSDAKIVLGKAPNHAYLMYQPGSAGPRVEGYYSTKKKSIVFSGEENSQYSQAFDNRSWKTIFSRLSISGLVDDNWKIRGCPPVCGEREFVNVGEIISGYWDSGVEGKEKTLKRKDAESLVQNFRIKKAIQNKDLNHMAYLYRYADGQVHSGRIKTFLEWLGSGFLYHGADPDNRESIRTQVN